MELSPFSAFPAAPHGRAFRIDRQPRGHLARVQPLHLAAEPHRRHQHARVARNVDRQPHEIVERPPGRDEAVAAHQRDAPLSQSAGEIASLLDVAHQQIRIDAEAIRDIPHRDRRPHVADVLQHGTERHARDRERQHVLRVRVQHRVDVGPQRVDGAVDEPLQIERPLLRLDRHAVVRELDDVAGLDDRRPRRARQKMPRRMKRMADAHVPVGIEHPLMRENAIGDHMLAFDPLDRVHPLPLAFEAPVTAAAPIRPSISG